MRILLLQILLTISLTANGQVINTIAGNGLPSNTGDSGYASFATIYYPVGGTFDKNGNYYFATEVGGNIVRKISTDGIITRIAGTGVAGFSGDSGLAINAKLNHPNAVATDTNGSIYICDGANYRIRKVEINTGIITTIAGNGTNGFGGDGLPAINSIISPHGVCTDKLGNIYISDYNNNRIRKIEMISGIITTIAGTGVAGYNGDGGFADTSLISQPYDICTDDTGNVYFVDKGNARVRKINNLGIISTIAGTGTGGLNGYSGDSGDSGLAINAAVAPAYVTVNKLGEIFIGCWPGSNAGYRVRKINNQGVINTIVGNGTAGYFGDNGLATNSQINWSTGLAIDLCGNLLIADGFNYRIRKVWFNTDTLPQVNIAITPNDTVITGTQVTTTATATNHGTVTSYQWVKNGANAGTNSAYTYTPVTGDSIYCIATVRACTGRMYTDTTTTIHITVNSGVGVANTTNYRTHTYPNPVIDVLQVETTEAQQYVLHNLMGVAILQGTVDKNNTIDFKAIPAGTYLLQLTNTQGQREVVRVVKE